MTAAAYAGAPSSHRRRRVVCLPLTAVLLGGCALLRQPDPVPMRTVYDAAACPTTQAPVLLVLLPGVYMTPEELLQQGFVAALRQRGLAVDVLLADAHIGYVRDGSMRRRLHDEVLAPARAWGYRKIWLAGISLGGFVALAYAMQQPGEVQGVLALAPYLGRPELLQAMADAGGPRAWAAQAQQPHQRVPTDGADIEAALWRWLAAVPGAATASATVDATARPAAAAATVAASAEPPPPQVWLGYGADDRFAPAHRQLAALLPSTRTAVVPGGHDWPPWRALWAQWLDRGVLPAACTAV